MPYTLLKFLGWGIAFFVIGVLVGWLLRALKSRAEVAAVRRSTIGDDDLERMRLRLADLEAVVAERDEMGAASRSRGTVDVDDPAPADDVDGGERHVDASGPPGPDESVATVHGVADRDDGDVAATSSSGASTDETGVPESGAANGLGTVRTGSVGGDDVPEDEPVLDLEAAASVLGSTVRLDDLTTVEGIGPKIAELCAGIGVTTWSELAGTNVATLQSMLDAAGSRYKVHDPSSWPEQAALLAAGRWEDFRQLTGELSSGR